MSEKVVKSFVKQVIAKLKGDDAEVVAQKNFRKASAAVKGQIAALEARKVDDEMAVENAKEAFNDALYPTVVTDAQVYTSNLVKAKKVVEQAEEQLKATEDSIAFFTELADKIEE